jgi:glycosyltransferase involved in cell wall biosynthesis
MGRIAVLIACMHREDDRIAEMSNIQTDAVIVNQCNKNAVSQRSFINNQGETCCIKFISTTDRGLSNSRNKAIEYAESDICILADDDEIFESDYATQLLNEYEKNQDADVIVFNFYSATRRDKSYMKKAQKVGYITALRVSSIQISFRRKSVIEKGISFDKEMGAGTGHGPCEENKFLYECLRNGLKIYYVPIRIVTLKSDSESTWFKGYDKNFFLQRGWAISRIMGRPMATVYCFYSISKRYLTESIDCSFTTALAAMLKGIYSKNPF